MSEISFNQADIDINNDYIKKIEKKNIKTKTKS